jgi:hypothetical protein
MKNKLLSSFIFFVIIFCFIISSCNNKHPLKPDYSNIGGYVIGNETCNTDISNNYWLLDFTVYPNSPHVGDTFVLNNITYTNVLKVKGLDPRLKQIGMRVSIDYNKISSNKIITSGCTVPSPVIYPLKEIFIINQGEIR